MVQCYGCGFASSIFTCPDCGRDFCSTCIVKWKKVAIEGNYCRGCVFQLHDGLHNRQYTNTHSKLYDIPIDSLLSIILTWNNYEIAPTNDPQTQEEIDAFEDYNDILSIDYNGLKAYVLSRLNESALISAVEDF